jgi:hypothetical protein
MDDSKLRALIKSEIRSGRLPGSAEEDRLFGGAGEGSPCACCGETIGAGAVQFEVLGNGPTLLMHIHCYDEWCQASELLRQESCTGV